MTRDVDRELDEACCCCWWRGNNPLSNDNVDPSTVDVSVTKRSAAAVDGARSVAAVGSAALRVRSHGCWDMTSQQLIAAACCSSGKAVNVGDRDTSQTVAVH